ncbi:MAG: NADH-quinone oxidoreductase subunit M [Anaerolineae bacterium]|nr:NADH-quinone oxidoreductase subunit M [Anaerolineae bacterium]
MIAIGNLFEIPLLSAIIFLPVLGAVVMLLLPRDNKALVRWTALGFSLVVFVLTVVLWFGYDRAVGGFQFVEKTPWFSLLGASWHLGVDGISIVMILLTGLLVPLGILISFEIEEQVNVYMMLFLLLEAGMMGVFVALDLMIFFLFWEIGLVPMYFLINRWGGENRLYASVKFFLYTMAGSLGLLLSIQLIGITAGTMDIVDLTAFWPTFQGDGGQFLGIGVDTVKWLTFLAFFLAFAIKVPIWPFHTWLPDAHTEAPTAGSMLLAGVLLKLGAYGFLRLVIPLFPEQAAAFAPVLAFLGMMGIILGAFAAYGQDDFKRLVAYSSVNHMGFVVLGIAVMAWVYGILYTNGAAPWLNLEAGTVALADTQSAIIAANGAVLQMFNHGLSSAGMFLLVGALYHKAHTRDLRRMGGLWVLAPVYGGILIFTSMASLGLPGLNGFVGEFLVVRGAWPVFTVATLLSMIGLLFTGAYILKALQKVLHGKPAQEWVDYHYRYHNLEISLREVVAMAPLLVLFLVTGVLPNWILPMINETVTRLFGG